MKIGLFNDSFPPTIDGVANTMLNYAKTLHANGDEVKVVTPKYPHVEDNYDFEVYRYFSISAKPFSEIPYRVGNPFSPPAATHIRKMDLDIIHIHSPFVSSMLVGQAFRFTAKKPPVVVTYHTKFDIDIKRYLSRRHSQRLMEKFVLKNLKKADEVWAVSAGTVDSLRAIGFTGSFRIMPNGTDFPKGKADGALVNEIDRMYKTKDDKLVFLYCGRMMWYKNLKIILDALRILKNEGISFRMFFVGDAPDRPAVEEYSKKQGLGADVIFTGAVTDREMVRAYFSRADLLLFPSTYDTNGLVVKEAAACGCPSALIAGSCAAEGITGGETGILADGESAESFARALLQAVREPDLLKKIGINAQDKVYMSWEDSVLAARKQYDEIVAKKAERTAFFQKKR